MSSTDTLLIDRWIRRRDAEAFNEIVLRYSSLVYGTCRRVLRNHADAEEVTQDCFLHLARAGTPPRRSLGGWFHTLATHRALDRIKSQVRRRRREERFAASREPQEASEWDEVEKLVDDAIEALPEELRTLIVAHFLEQRSQESIARELGLSRQTVTYRIRKGIEKVRRQLARRGVAVAAASLSSMLSTNLVEAAPAGLKAALGKIALAGSRAAGAPAGASAASAGAAGTATLGALGGIGVMYKFTAAAAIAAILMLIIGYGLSSTEEGAVPPAGDGSDALAARTAASAGGGEDPAVAEPVAAESAVEVAPPVATVDPDRLIRGRVVDPDGQAVADAVVAAGNDSEKLVEATADVSGIFALQPPEAGSYLVCAFKDGAGLGASEAQTGGEDVVVKLEPLCSVSGRVFDKETGKGIDDAKIGLNYFGDFNRQEPARLRAFTWLDVRQSRNSERSPDGRYHLGNLLEARYLLEIRAAGYVAPGTFGKPYLELVLMKSEERTGFDVALEQAGAVSGRVFDPDGMPLSGAHAHIRSSRHSFDNRSPVTTDDDGGYRFGGLAVGASYAVIVDHEDLAQSYSEAVTLSSPREIEGLDVHMTEGHAVSGRVVDDLGNRVPGAKFRLGTKQWTTTYWGGREEIVTDEEGSFLIERVGPGEYRLVARVEGYESFRVRSLIMPPDRDLHDQVFVLTREAKGFVSGRVTDSAGEPLEGIRLVIDNDRRGPHVSGEAYTDDAGFYRFEGIGKAKTFRIGVYTQNYAYEEREQIPLNAEDVNFTLERLASVILRAIDDETGEPVQDFEARATSYRSRPTGIPAEHWIPVHSEAGEVVLDDIEPPESGIEVRAEGYAPFVTERIEIQSAEVIELEVRLRRGATIGGRAVDAATARPLPGVRVRIYERNYFHPLLMRDEREALTDGFQALAVTDEEGRFEFAGLDPDGAVDLVAWRDGLGTQVLTRVRSPRELQLKLHSEARLAVTVRRGLEPAKEISVSVSLNEDRIGADYWSGQRSSDAGLAEFSSLRPGSYNIFVRTKEDDGIGSLTREIPAGETVKLDIDLEEIEKRFARIAGTIAGVSEPVYVTLSRKSDPKKTIASVFTRESKSSFRLGGITAGDYILRGATEAKRQAEQMVTVRAGEELKVELEFGR